MKDSHGRVIDYLRISLTDRCNLRCVYCMPEDGVTALSHEDILRMEEIVRIVRVAADLGISRVRLTGGEPLVRKGVADLIADINGIPGIESIAMTTNGVLLPRMADELKAAGLSRVNISLDTVDEDQFNYITRVGHVQSVFDGIDAALEAGFNPVKINAVVVRSLNQDLYGFARMSVDRPLHMRFIEYMPVGAGEGSDATNWGPEDVIDSEDVFKMINDRARELGEPELVPAREDAPVGWGPARYYRFPDSLGTVGFISPLSRHFCSECNRLRMTADGKIRPCLFSDEELDMRAAVREGTDEDIRNVFLAALGAKPDEHHHKVGTARKMVQIGG